MDRYNNTGDSVSESVKITFSVDFFVFVYKRFIFITSNLKYYNWFQIAIPVVTTSQIHFVNNSNGITISHCLITNKTYGHTEYFTTAT